MKLIYNSNGKKIQFTAAGGFVLNALIDAYEKIGSTRIELTNDYEKIGVSATASVGATINCSSEFRLNFLPTFQYTLTNLGESSINEHLFSAGLNIGGFYHF